MSTRIYDRFVKRMDQDKNNSDRNSGEDKVKPKKIVKSD